MEKEKKTHFLVIETSLQPIISGEFFFPLNKKNVKEKLRQKTREGGMLSSNPNSYKSQEKHRKNWKIETRMQKQFCQRKIRGKKERGGRRWKN